jgi:hypothetical protein
MGLNIRPESLNLLDKTGEILQDIGIVNGFLDRTPKALETEAKN